MTREQLSFGFEQLADEARRAHLPRTLDEAIPYYRAIIERHHQAMLAGNEHQVKELRKEAHDLAVRINNGDAAIMGHSDAPAYVLARATAATPGIVPLWGQTGEYTITIGDLGVRIAQDGIFGIGAQCMTWLGFRAHAIHADKPFLSETGYRSFLGCHRDMTPGITPDAFAKEMINAYIANECNGRLRTIEPDYATRLRNPETKS